MIRLIFGGRYFAYPVAKKIFKNSKEGRENDSESPERAL